MAQGSPKGQPPRAGRARHKAGPPPSPGDAALLRQVFDHAPVLINFIGAAGGLELVNHRWEEVTGWKWEEVRRKHLDVFSAAYPDPAERRRALAFVQAGTGEWEDFQLRRRDGQPVDLCWAVVRLADGSRIGFGREAGRAAAASGTEEGAAAHLPVRVLLAERQTLVRAGLRALLEAMPGVEVVAEAASGREAVELAGVHRPAVAVLDLNLPELNGPEAAARIAGHWPEVRVVLISRQTTEEIVARALRSGVKGYLLKDAAPEEFALAVRAVARGDLHFCSAVSKHLVESYLRHTEMPDAGADPLTARQREVLQLLAEGQAPKEIAFGLRLSVKTVETHRAEVMRRLGIRDVPGLVRYALRTGLIAAED